MEETWPKGYAGYWRRFLSVTDKEMRRKPPGKIAPSGAAWAGGPRSMNIRCTAAMVRVGAAVKMMPGAAKAKGTRPRFFGPERPMGEAARGMCGSHPGYGIHGIEDAVGQRHRTFLPPVNAKAARQDRG